NLNPEKHDSRTEEKIYKLLEDPAVTETLIGKGEIESVEHIGENIYLLTTTSFPDTFLMKVNDNYMEVFGPERKINEFQLTGKSEHWEAVFEVTQIGWDNEISNLTISYTGDDEAPKSLHYESEDGGFSGKKSDWNGRTITSGSGCGGCSLIDEDKPIKITFEWEGHTEELTLTKE